MRKIVLFVVLLVFGSVTFAQVSKTISLTTAGSLSVELSSEELNTITDLTVTGNIDARDFKTMRDEMPVLAIIDLSGVNVAEYYGVEGTDGTENTKYFENEIPNNALKSKASLSIFKFPESVTSIGYFAFSNCSALKHITIPNKVETVKMYSFEGCSSTNTINIPPSLLSIEPYAFNWTSGEVIVDTNNPNYSSLDGVLFNKDHTSLIQFPTSKLGTYIMPNTINHISIRAFAACKISTISFSSNLESTGYSAFAFSDSLKKLTISPTIKHIDNESFYFCKNLEEVTLSEGIISIGERAFNWCFSLKSITIPKSVNKISNYAFQGCQMLSSITALSKIPVDISNSPNVFEFVNKIGCTLYVPHGSKTAYQSADQWKDFLNIVEMEPSYDMPLQVEAGGLAALLPQSVRDTITYLALTGAIDARDFKTMRDEMPLLAEIDLSGVTIVAYTGTDGTSITGNNVYPENTIPETAFMNASYRGKISLTNIELPNTVQFIGHQAFRSCTGLTSMTFPSSLLSISSFAFGACFNLTSVTIPASVTTIGNYAFGDSPVYFSVDENNLFYTSVDGILFNKSKTFLFQATPSINGNFVIPSTVLTIGGYAFSRASGLLSVTIPSSVKTIMEGAFTACEGLSTIEFPTSVTSIGNVAFQSCYGLTSIIAPWPIPLSLGSGVFNNIDKTTCTLKVPQGAKAAYQATEQWKDFLNIVEMEATELELTHVPDDNFEQALIDLGYDSGPLDDYVSTANISSVTRLYVYSKNISSLTGIQDFVLLEDLNCSNNQLINIDLSNNLKLTQLECSMNSLTSIDVSKNQALSAFGCAGNLLTSLDLSKNLNLTGFACSGNNLSVLDLTNNTKLEYLRCDQNKLTSIDLSTMPSLKFLECSDNLINSIDVSMNRDLVSLNCSNNNLDFLNLRNGNNANMVDNNNGKGLYVTGNPNLFCIQVDDPVLSSTYTSWYKDAKASYSSDCEESGKLMTYIPDDNFEQALIDLGYDSGPLNDSIPTINISGITNLTVSFKNISDLTGIEDFKALKSLDCSYNQLIKLYFSNNLNLTTLYCNNNKLTSLSLKNGYNSNFFQYYKTFDSRNNPQLFCIQVDDPTIFAGYPGVFKDSYSSYSNDCSLPMQMTYVPDDNFEQALIDLGFDSGSLDDYVPTNNIRTITYLNVSGKKIADLTGIEDFEALKILRCGLSNLSSINISKNTQLEEINLSFNKINDINLNGLHNLTDLYLRGNNLESLNLESQISLKILQVDNNFITDIDLSKNTLLEYLVIDNNLLNTLDLSKNTMLNYLSCKSNKLQSLNIQNGNNSPYTGLIAIDNPNLYCIQVDDPIAAKSYQGWNKEIYATYSLDCNNYVPLFTYVPDDNFEQALIDLGYDSGSLDDSVLTANISSITTLNVSRKNISDLTGIEAFSALTNLNCSQNSLSSLDLSHNILLTSLTCDRNQLSVLDVSKNLALISLSCSYNQLSFIDLSNNPNIQTLTLGNNNLNSLDVSKNNALKILRCNSNQLTTLDININTLLTELDCRLNKLTEINVNVNVNLSRLFCSSNPITSLDISKNTLLTHLACESTLINSLDISANILLQTLFCGYNNLTGINLNSNPELTHLSCQNNSIENLDFSNNTKLIYLNCRENKLKELDFSKNPLFRELLASNNELSKIDLTKHPDIIQLVCDNNQIEILDLSKNSILRHFSCKSNKLRKLNIQNGNNTNFTGFDASNNPKLTCIQVDDPIFSGISTNWLKDPQANYSTLCNSSPVANAGPDQTVDERVLVTLYGTDSYDPENQTITFAWTAPEGIVLSSTTIANPTFTAPDVSEDTELIFSLKVNDGTVDSKPDSVHILIKNIYIPQTISLNSGWNIMSLYVLPQENNLKTILQPLIDSGKLKKVMNENGYVIEDWGKFGGWQNTIGDIMATEGYNINVTAPATFNLEGIPVQFPFEIPLTAGWNIISWPSVMEQNGLEVFQTLIDEGKLKKVMDESGKAIENWGVFGGWQNAIGNLKPGEGYKVNVSSASTLVINETATKSDGIIPELVASTHFIPAYKGNGTEHMNINLVNIHESGIIAGDEIGIFDGNTCVGVATISGLNHAISIPVSAAGDDKAKDGFIPGNSIILKLYRDGVLYNLGFQPINNEKTVFVRNGSLFVFIDVLESSAKNELIRNPKIHCFPNPFSDAISIEVFVPGEPGLQVTIHDSSGRKVKDLYKGSNDGKITLIWDGTNEFRQKVSPGIYSVQANKHNIKIIRK